MVQVVDKAVMILTNDNLELACQVVEKTASEKALREVDERLQMAYQVQHADEILYTHNHLNPPQAAHVHEVKYHVLSSSPTSPEIKVHCCI